jgi:hypothetical protein
MLPNKSKGRLLSRPYQSLLKEFQLMSVGTYFVIIMVLSKIYYMQHTGHPC